jgi:hypothetical protein
MKSINCPAMRALAITTAGAQTRNRALPLPGGSSWISCGTFMKRLREAGRVLTFPLPPVKIERNPYVTDSDAFWVSYAYSNGREGQQGYEGSLGCSRGHIDDYQMDLDHFDERRSGLTPEALRNVHIVAAAIYAYTGWPPRQVIALANKIVAKQPHDVTAGVYEESLPNEGGITIGVVDVMVSGKCDPIAFPTICGTSSDKPK